MGGIYALANIRGGGEYGKDWHEAGMLAKKQNVFDDFIAAAEYLITEKYTSTPKLAIRGGSNGGLLVGAVMTQRPELFGAALPAVGVMDMLRFQKFTIGWAWTSDYGSSDDADAVQVRCARIRRCTTSSRARAIRRRWSPPPITTTASCRATHSSSRRRCRRRRRCANPILIRIETKAGHGAGKPTTKQIDEAADRFAFLVRELHMKPALQ